MKKVTGVRRGIHSLHPAYSRRSGPGNHHRPPRIPAPPFLAWPKRGLRPNSGVREPLSEKLGGTKARGLGSLEAWLKGRVAPAIVRPPALGRISRYGSVRSIHDRQHPYWVLIPVRTRFHNFDPWPCHSRHYRGFMTLIFCGS